MVPKDLIGVEHAGFEIKAARNYSNNRGDEHLFVVLGQREDGEEYVIWTYNSQTEGFTNGKYIHKKTKSFLIMQTMHSSPEVLLKHLAFKEFDKR